MALKRGLRRYGFGRAGILVAAVCLIALTWIGTLSAMRAERGAARARMELEAFDQALAFGEQFRVQILGCEQTLRLLERDWESDPDKFDFSRWRGQILLTKDPTVQIFIANSQGVIENSTNPDLVGTDISKRDLFEHEQALPADDVALFIGRTTDDLVTGRWDVTLSRRLDSAAGAFRGIVGAAYDTGTLETFYGRVAQKIGGVVAVLGSNGIVRAIAGDTPSKPGQDLAASEMVDAIRDGRDSWIGPSAMDGVVRIHGFYRLPDHDLTIVFGYDRDRAMRSSDAWQRGALLFAVGITLFLVVIATLQIRDLLDRRMREENLACGRRALEGAYAQLKLAKSRADAKTAQLEATLAGMSDGVSMLDADLRLVQWNERFCELTGVPANILRVGLPMADILRAQAEAGEFGDVEVAAEVERRLRRLRNEGSTVTIERQRPDGSTVELRRSPLPTGGFVTLYSDITARKQAEAAQRAARETAERTAMEKSRFAAIVSHEIRTPLNTLLSSIEMLSESGISPAHRRLVLLAHQAGDALHGLLNDILEMSTLEAGRLSLRCVMFDLRPLLQGALDMFRRDAWERGISLRLEIEADVPDRLYADPVRLRQVLINLLSNAVKFSAPGDVILSACRSDSGDKPNLRLCVTDQGPAISEADRSRLFQPFSRIEHEGADDKPGSGLGLAICLRLMQLMGGEIGYTPTSRQENAFFVVLPLRAAPAGAEDAKKPAKGPALVLPRTRILLVDDIAANQMLTATLLRRAGHSVDTVASGPAALDALGQRQYDILLMDIMMPRMSGLETARRVRMLDDPARSVPIVALTANVGPEDRELCLAAGMQSLLGKPVDLPTLVEEIARHVWPARAMNEPEARLQPDGPPGSALSQGRLDELREELPKGALLPLFESCLAELQERLPVLRRALDNQDIRAVEEETHAMAGVAAGYGMQALDRRLRAIQAVARKGDAEDARAMAESLEEELRRAEQALREALRLETV